MRAVLGLALGACLCACHQPEAPKVCEQGLKVPQVQVVGVDAPFEVRIEPGCDGLSATPTFKQVGGPEVKFTTSGWMLHGQSPALKDLGLDLTTPGLVAVSPRTDGTVRFEATLESEGQRWSVPVELRALHRSGGLINVGVGHRLLLAGSGWRPKAPSAAVEFRDLGEASTLRLRAPGPHVFVRGEQTLRLVAGRYEDVPLDCGRCHAEQVAAAQNSPMTHVLSRGLAGELGADYDPGCVIGCHTVGVVDALDGGFWDVSRDFHASALRGKYEALPAALQRLSSVGCLACHGPATLPEVASRKQAGRTALCASCHDAPPRYGHVQAFSGTTMARGNTVAQSHDLIACARCHTTRGARQPGATASASGLDCIACHEPHGPSVGALLRQVSPPEAVADIKDPATRLCNSCHAEPAWSTAGLVLLGRGGRDLRTGRPVSIKGPHAELECTDCHRHGPDVERGADHGFAARLDDPYCRRCHEDPPSWTPPEGSAGHALGVPGFDLESKEGRLAYHRWLLDQDRAALVHNAPFARWLAERAAERPVPPAAPVEPSPAQP